MRNQRRLRFPVVFAIAAVCLCLISCSVESSLDEDQDGTGDDDDTALQADDADFPDNYIVGAHYYPWYNTGGHHWVDPPYERTHLLDPYLGEYDCSDPLVAEQQIEWAAEYGLDVLTLEWFGPDSYAADNLEAGFFQAGNLNRIHFCIFYDTMIRMAPIVGGGWSMNINFSEPEVRQTFIDDLVGIAEKYFDHPQYFKISERPVMWIYWTIGFTGDFPGAMEEARAELMARGYDLYLVADYPFVELKPGFVPYFDAISAYCIWQKFLYVAFDTRDIGHLADVLELLFKQTRERVTQMQVAGRDDGAMVDFHPGVIPQFDDSWMEGFPRVLNFPVHASSKDDVIKMFQVAREATEPAYDSDLHITWITSFNEWHETTTIEPAIVDAGPAYPCGNYGFDFMEAVQEVFSE